jgi:RimJ/RimL family protein N-acetyltransferase
MLIRDLVPGDVDAYIRLLQIAFASNPLEAEQTAARIRSLARANMVPFRLLTWLTQQKWAVLVAEKPAGLVGAASLIGTAQSLYLLNLMVSPEHQRQGIASALIQAALQRAARLQVPIVYASILAHNHPSLGAFAKNGFTHYHTTFSQQMPLPANLEAEDSGGNIRCRPLTAQDRPALESFAAQALGAKRLAVEVSMVKRAYRGLFGQLFQRWLFRRKGEVLLLEEAGQLTGFVRFFIELRPKTGVAWFEATPNISLTGWRKLFHEVVQWQVQQGGTCLDVVATQALLDLDNALKPGEILQHWYRRV